MVSERSVILKMASHLLQYPDEELLNSLAPLGEAIAALPPGRAREALGSFAAYLQTRPLLRLKEEYSRHFDLNPAASLNLTYHRFGDGRERGTALVQLLRAYREAGYEPATRELPDYLPLVLEFLAICPEAAANWIVQEYLPQVAALANRLSQADTPYGRLLSMVVENLGSLDPGREG